MNSNEELYAFIENLISELEQQNHRDYSERLYQALHISSVVTEVFMNLRYELTRLENADINISPSSRVKIAEAIRDISLALR